MSRLHDVTPRGRAALAIGLIVLAGLAGCSAVPPTEGPRNADPRAMPAIEEVVARLDDHRLVAIGETHGSEQMASFLLSLVADPSFQSRSGTLVLEIGSSAQGTIDDYINGGLTTEAELLVTLRDSIFSESGAADPRSTAVFTEVRRLNESRPAESRLRIVAADAPLRWSEVNRPEDLEAFDRESAMAEIILQQVLDTGRPAVWVVGGGHLSPPPAQMAIGEGDSADSPGSALDHITAALPPGAVFVATMYTGFGARTGEIENKIGAIEAPAILDLAGTWLGEDSSIELGSPHDLGDIMIDDSGATMAPAPEPSGRSLASRQDGLLWLGDCDSLSPQLPDRAVFDDPEYRAELDRRAALTGLSPAFDVEGYFDFLTELYGPC
jgi:hypothetical protein